ncbi:hypothetical protein GCM10010389_30810 [Streptomyces echinoruber]|uniref:Uncharacterized protein n=1 Tax=Streptomyces echinoruber TaxID=68898 RepID=A0A918VD40_9ACTN|nr:hypothetical protein GCM10010389_30810 [Streptomyces echinoruber]
MGGCFLGVYGRFRGRVDALGGERAFPGAKGPSSRSEESKEAEFPERGGRVSGAAAGCRCGALDSESDEQPL